MKRILFRIIDVMGMIHSYTWPLSFSSHFENWRARFFTGYLRRRFKAFGQRSLIYPRPYTLLGLEYVSIGNDSVIGSDVQLTVRNLHSETSAPSISIGNGCHIRSHAHLSAINQIVIGDNLLTGTNVLITDNSHGLINAELLKEAPIARPLATKGPVVIGNNVWLGNNVCVMPGVTIGDGVVVGANSIVTHDLPSYCMAAGIPAQIVKQV